MMEPVAIVEGENERYAAVLVFLHGLWTGPEIWRPLAYGFAHRGWRCALVDARAARPADEGFGGWCGVVRERLTALGQPTVLIGHDAGGLVALALAGDDTVAAAVAVAPLVGGAGGLVDPLTRLRTRLRIGAAPPPPPAHPYRRLGDAKAQTMLAGALAPEPARRVASLYGHGVERAPADVPVLLVGQAADAVVAPPVIEKVSREIGADFLSLPGSHWPMLEPGPDAWLSPVHRWLVRRLGASLLLLRGDEDLVEE